MPSRGVVFGDVMRANDFWNDRLAAVGESKGVDLDVDSATIGEAESSMLSGDLFDASEAHSIVKMLVRNYTGVIDDGPVSVQLLSCAIHAMSIGVLVERQRWDTTDIGPGDGQG